LGLAVQRILGERFLYLAHGAARTSPGRKGHLAWPGPKGPLLFYHLIRKISVALLEALFAYVV